MNQAYPLSMPEAALYGRLGDVARTMQAPIGPAYVALLTLYSGQGINVGDPQPDVRGTLFSVQLGGAGVGKSLIVNRALRSLYYSADHTEPTTAVSDRGILSVFRRGLDRKDDPGPLRPGVLVIDEMIAMLKKMSIEGSTLQQILNTLYYQDRVGVADKQGECSINARISLLGNLTLDSAEEFAERFSGDSKGGFVDRLVLAPLPDNWSWDRTWRPVPIPLPSTASDWFDDSTGPEIDQSTNPLIPSHNVCFPVERHAELDAWTDAHRVNNVTVGRTREIAERVALISTSANGDTEVSTDCLRAAMAMADWQIRVRAIYSPGSGRNPDAIVMGVVLDGFAAAHKSEADGCPMTSVDGNVTENGWVRLARLAKRNNWSRKYGPTLSRVIDSLVKCGALEELEVQDGPRDRPRKTKKFRLTDIDSSIPAIDLPSTPAEPKEAA